jgi:hypothetical protein
MGLGRLWALRVDLLLRHQGFTVPRRKKKPRELTDEEVLRRMFPKEAREVARREARKAALEKEKKSTNG